MFSIAERPVSGQSPLRARVCEPLRGNRFSFLKPTMFTSRDAATQPKLRGKAVEIRDFAPVLLEIFKEFCNPEREIHNKIVCLLEGAPL